MFCICMYAESVLLKAGICLPVVGLFFVGTVMPSSSKYCANFCCEAIISRVVPESSIACAVSCLIFSLCAISISLSKTSLGSTNIRTVISIMSNSVCG